ncbi:SCO family protein [Candidatus Thalassolituus haligoni]|uniref:SCO family protein n=1 Tax=Candidatus Thalassolituus haligoni TaxID=3100113 RepID=UPI003516D47F|tara:strand:+ start:13259 stop:13897 length:639 start_codon:yes stop_codon:yes gene_type:complete
MNNRVSAASRVGAILLFVVLAVSAAVGMLMAHLADPAARLGSTSGVMLFNHSSPVSDFKFIDQHGEHRDQASFSSGWKLVFFGYTFCPDICPTTLADLNRVWKALPDEARQRLDVVFVSVDPQRDRPASLAPYLQYFNPAFVGLTGNPQALAQLAQEINGFYARVDRGEAPYLMDHSANLMLVDAQWQFRGYIEPPFRPGRLTPILAALAGM